jgi:hypothetical protein
MTPEPLFKDAPSISDADRIQLHLESFTRELAIEVFRTVTRRSRVHHKPTRKGAPSSLKSIGEKYGIAWDDKSLLHIIAGCAVLRSCLHKDRVLAITQAAIEEAISQAA